MSGVGLQTAREIVWHCASACGVSDVESFYIPDPVLLKETGSYVSDSCMRFCVEETASKILASVVDAKTMVANTALDPGKQVLEISTKETIASISDGLIALIVIVAAVYFLYRPRNL